MAHEKKKPLPTKVRFKDEVYELAQDVANRLGITAGKIQNGIRHNLIRSIKQNGRLYVVTSSVEKFIQDSKKYKPGTLWKAGWTSLKISYNVQRHD